MLPTEPYEFSEWRICRVGIDCHIEVAAHCYSVPHRFARAEVDARLTAQTVEIFLKEERIAAHMRGAGNHKHTTVTEHMPSSHRRYAGWTIERIRADARLIGPATAALCELILEQRPHPEQGFRACLGVVRLARLYGAERLEKPFAPNLQEALRKAPTIKLGSAATALRGYSILMANSKTSQ